MLFAKIMQENSEPKIRQCQPRSRTDAAEDSPERHRLHI